MNGPQGTVPFPSRVQPGPLRQLAAELRTVGAALSGELVSTVGDVMRASRETWSGSAADAFTSRAAERRRVLADFGDIVDDACVPLEVYATAIEAAYEGYATAVSAERFAERLPQPSRLQAEIAAVGAQTVAVGALHAAGVAFAAAMSTVTARVFVLDAVGSIPSPAELIGATAASISERGVLATLVEGVNVTVTSTAADGSTGQYNVLGTALDGAFGRPLEALQTVIGTVSLLTATPLSVRNADSELDALRAGGFVDNPTNWTQIGNNLLLTEVYQRERGIESDQSSVIPVLQGRAPNGQRVFTAYIPGIVPPGDDAIAGYSGNRNVVAAGGSQVTQLGTVETAMLAELENRGLRPGDRVVLNGHSFGGIVARNTANELRRRGYDVAFVSVGSPDGPVEPGVEAYMVQNVNDPVPAARIGGDGIAGTRYAPGQQVIRLYERAPGDLIDNHAAVFYGQQLDRSPNPELQAFLRRQSRVQPVSSGMFILEGTGTPDRVPNTGAEPYRLPAPK
jgi:hypothetical protein